MTEPIDRWGVQRLIYGGKLIEVNALGDRAIEGLDWCLYDQDTAAEYYAASQITKLGIEKIPAYRRERVAYLLRRKEIERMLTTEKMEEVVGLGEEAIPFLLDLLLRNNYEMGKKSGAALVKFGPNAIPYLLHGLEDAGYDRSKILRVLGQFGSSAEIAVPAIIKLYSDENAFATVGALSKIGGEDALEFLKQRLEYDRVDRTLKEMILIGLLKHLPESFRLISDLIKRDVIYVGELYTIEKRTALRIANMLMDSKDKKLGSEAVRLIELIIELDSDKPATKQEIISLAVEISAVIRRIENEKKRGELKDRFQGIYQRLMQELTGGKSRVKLGNGILSKGLPKPPKHGSYRVNTRRAFT